MEKLNLNELLKIDTTDRNEFVFDSYRSEENNILLCCGNVEGVLIEEDLEEVLESSSIDLLVSNTKVTVLVQKEQIYVADLNAEEDDGITLYYLDFSTLREITALKDTYVGVLSVGGIIGEIYIDTDQNRVEEIMYTNYPVKDFDSSEDDARIFNGLGEEIKSCYSEGDEEDV